MCFTFCEGGGQGGGGKENFLVKILINLLLVKLRKFTRKQFKTIKWKCCLESGECCRTNWIISTTHLSSELWRGCPTKYMKIERSFLVLIAFKYLRVYPNKVSRIKTFLGRLIFFRYFLSWDSYQSFRSYLDTLEVLGCVCGGGRDAGRWTLNIDGIGEFYR